MAEQPITPASAADVLAVAAHRDDVEQTCGGTLLRMRSIGVSTAILDLTQGEAGTRGSTEDRAAEAAEAARHFGCGTPRSARHPRWPRRKHLGESPEGRRRPAPRPSSRRHPSLLDRPSSRPCDRIYPRLRSLLPLWPREDRNRHSAPPPLQDRLRQPLRRCAAQFRSRHHPVH